VEWVPGWFAALSGGAAGLREVHGGCSEGGRQMYRPAVAVGSLSMAGVRGSPVRWCSRVVSRRREPGAGDASACGFGTLYGPVRGCPSDRRRGWPGVRTNSGQGRRSEHHPVVFAQVRWCLEIQAGAVCKTVGSAYVGSNPTPATTCENGPLAANARAGGPFLLGPGVCHLVALWTVMLRCPRTHSGRASVRLGRSVCAATTVGVHSYGGRCAPSAFPRTATDGPRWRRVQT